MYVIKTISKIEQVGFVSTRFQGIDGVNSITILSGSYVFLPGRYVGLHV